MAFCTSPKYLKSHRSDEFPILSSCGHCAPCRERRAASLSAYVNRLADEANFVTFTTITYDDEHVPYAYRVAYDDEKSTLLFNGLYFDLPNADYNLIHASQSPSLSEREGVAVLDSRDMTLFLKRVRINLLRELAARHYGNSSQLSINRLKNEFPSLCKFKYALCGEYGKRTFRPHYHLIGFFKTAEVYSSFLTALHKSWPCCDTSQLLTRIVDNVRRSEVTYIAKYIAKSAGVLEIIPFSAPFFRHSNISREVGVEGVVRDFERAQRCVRQRVVEFNQLDSMGRPAPDTYTLEMLRYRFPQSAKFDRLPFRSRSYLLRLLSELSPLCTYDKVTRLVGHSKRSYSTQERYSKEELQERLDVGKPPRLTHTVKSVPLSVVYRIANQCNSFVNAGLGTIEDYLILREQVHNLLASIRSVDFYRQIFSPCTDDFDKCLSLSVLAYRLPLYNPEVLSRIPRIYMQYHRMLNINYLSGISLYQLYDGVRLDRRHFVEALLQLQKGKVDRIHLNSKCRSLGEVV